MIDTKLILEAPNISRWDNPVYFAYYRLNKQATTMTLIGGDEMLKDWSLVVCFKLAVA
jgi:hypothetical protein